MGLSLSYGGIYVISPWIMTTFATWIRRYFLFYLWESGDRIVFPLILFLMWRKEQKDEKYRGYLLMLLIAFCIQGCSKQQDVEDHRFVLAMGFERLNERKYWFVIRMRISTRHRVILEQNTIKVGDILATSLKDANKKWKQYKSQQLNFGHLKVVLFANGKKMKRS